MSLKTLDGLGAGDAAIAMRIDAITTFVEQLLDEPEDFPKAAFLHKIVDLARAEGVISEALLDTISQALDEKEADLASMLLESVVDAIPMGFLSLDELHAGIAGLRWLTNADAGSLTRSFCSPDESGVDPILGSIVTQFGVLVKLAAKDGFSAPWLGSAIADVITAIVTNLGSAYAGSSVLTASPEHVASAMVQIITVCAELIVGSAHANVSLNCRMRLVSPASTVLDSVLRVLTSGDSSELLDLGLVLPFSMFVPALLEAMQEESSGELLVSGAVVRD